MGQTALHFAVEPGDPKRLVGRQVANAGFLRAYLAHGAANPVHIHASHEGFEQFRALFPGSRALVHVPAHRGRDLVDLSGLFMPGPALAERAWNRRLVGRGKYSLSGVTHAMASRRAQDAVREMLVAPMAPWDALICASQSVKSLVERLIADYSGALAGIVRGRPEFKPQLPVIPLGADVEALSAIPDAAGVSFRAEHGIPADSFTVLYLGRLSYHTKAHPIQMYRALEQLAARIGRPVTLIEAGWYYNPETEAAFDAAARAFAPNIRVVKADAREEAVKQAVLSAADVFISLVDNVQESFGLTPVEAMAAGLPAISSDWDGYRDTVLHGETGFLIPTVIPPAGAGFEYAWRLAVGQDDYDAHVGVLAQHVAVEIPKAVDALAQLAEQPDLLRRMGDAARRRAREIYDWPVIVRAYDALWRDLEERRGFYSDEDPAAVPQPSDPFRTFAGFASERIGKGFRVQPVADAEKLLDLLQANPISSMDMRSLGDGRALVASMRQNGVMFIEQDMSELDVMPSARTFRALAWMLKMGVIERV